MSQGFAYHVLLQEVEICNYDNLKATLMQEILAGERIVMYGRRNTGKTSLIQSVIIPRFRKIRKDALVISCDFLGCHNLEQIAERLRLAFEDGFSKSYPKKSTFVKMIGSISNLRPSFEIDSFTGQIQLRLDASKKAPASSIEKIIEHISEIHRKYGVLLILDEFQEVAFVEEAEARLRRALQKCAKDMPVVVLGSKKHLLNRMFAKPNAPFANWGIPIDVPRILPSEYRRYINLRLEPLGKTLSSNSTRLLLEKMQFIPEGINLVCSVLAKGDYQGEIDERQLELAVADTLISFACNFQEFMAQLSSREQRLLTQLAKHQPLREPRSNGFLMEVGVPSATVGKLIKKFEDHAYIYHEKEGYVVADPLLGLYLKSR